MGTSRGSARRGHRGAGLLAAFLVLLAGVGLLSAPAAAGPGSTGSIAGTVTDAVTGAPIEGVEVVTSADGINEETATTGADGTYVIPDLEPGEYLVLFLPTQQSGYEIEIYDDAGAYDEPTPVVVGVEPVVGIDASLRRATGTIKGNVTSDACSCPVHGATVSFFGIDGLGPYLVAKTSTIKAGTYKKLVPNGDYKVRITAPGHVPSYSGGAASLEEAEVVTVAAGVVRVDAGLAVASTGEGTLTGRVLGSCGCPVVGAKVVILDLAEAVVANVTTGPGGTFRKVVPNGDYKLKFTAGGHDGMYSGGVDSFAEATVVTVAEDAARSDVQLVAGSATTGTIKGRILNACSCSVWGSRATFLDLAGNVVKTVTTNASGAYSKVVPNGDYKVRFTAPGYSTTYSGGASSFAGAEVVTVANDTVRVDATLLVPSALAGTVHDVGTSEPIEGATVSVFDPVTAELVATATTDEDGDYFIEPLPEGSYKISFEAPGYETQWAGWGGQTLETAVAVPVMGYVSYWGAELVAIT